MNKFLYTLLFSSLFFASCYDQERNCKDYKTGKFIFTQEINGTIETSIFERNDSIQIERFRNQLDTSSVRWINDCEFILKKTHPKNNTERKAIHIKILTTTKEGYSFEYGYVGDSKKQRGKVTLE